MRMSQINFSQNTIQSPLRDNNLVCEILEHHYNLNQNKTLILLDTTLLSGNPTFQTPSNTKMQMIFNSMIVCDLGNPPDWWGNREQTGEDTTQRIIKKLSDILALREKT